MDEDRDEAASRRRFRRSLGQLALAVVVVGALGLVVGFLFSRADPSRAARVLLRDRVVTEPVGEVTGPPAPSSGDDRGAPACGVLLHPADRATQVVTLASGLVVVQYREPTHAEELARWAADRVDQVLVAPNPDLPVAVMATAWGRRLRLAAADTNVLSAFVTAHAGLGPDVRPCR